MTSLCSQEKICLPSSPSSWSPPPPQMYKINLDGASKENPGPTSYGGICRDHSGRILLIFLGSLGSDTNNSTELEGLICGFEILIRGGYFSAIIEGAGGVRSSEGEGQPSMQCAMWSPRCNWYLGNLLCSGF